MSDDLLYHYEKELAFLKERADEFAKQHPVVAEGLRLEPNSIEDPLVKQLLSGVAFLNARVQQKISDGFPELTDAILETMYPHYLRPIPSMSIVQFTPASDLDKKIEITKDTLIKTSSSTGKDCRFNTSYDVDLLPLRITDAKLMPRPFVAPGSTRVQGATSVLKISFKTLSHDITVDSLDLTKIRMFLNGHSQHIYPLYDLIFTKCVKVVLANGDLDPHPIFLEANCLQQVGFDMDQGIIPYPKNSFVGYRLLTEYFTFQEKFQFIDITELKNIQNKEYGDTLNIYLYLSDSDLELEQQISENNFLLGCTPTINIFKTNAEPISLTHKEHRYPVVADSSRKLETEVYSISSVQAIDLDGEYINYRPFYGVNHSSNNGKNIAYWLTHRTNVLEGEHNNELATELDLSLVDLNNSPFYAANQKLTVEILCSNRNLPKKLPTGQGKPFYDLVDGALPTESISSIVTPTSAIRPALQEKNYWRLVSHLNLNHLSLTHAEGSLEALKEILRLYDFRDSASTRNIIDSIVTIHTKPISAPIQIDGLVGLCRGTQVHLTLDPVMLSGVSHLIFASVLERFFGLYVSINSFTKLMVSLSGKDGELKKWPARAGEKVLI